MYNPFSLEGKTILVTGASSGIGKGVAIDLSKMGAKVVITARNEERLNRTFESLKGDDHSKIIADLCMVEEVDFLINNIPTIDGAVFCAGIVKTLPVRNIKDDAIAEVFDANVISDIRLSSRLLKKKKLNLGASIVMISSVSTFNVKVGNSLYSATKGAMNSFAKTMALEVANQKIRVNCIQPGFVPTSILENHSMSEDALQWYAERHPLGFGNPTDIANACIYLLSDAARWVTGSIFTIDGGYTLQ
jgi:NAD(P)-dependent dehydrogenase (short-subunit alcohol dehydrogenase family)